MGKVSSGMVVRGTYYKPLPAGVLVLVKEIVGSVEVDGSLRIFDEPVKIAGKLVGKESVRQFPGSRELRDALLEAVNEPNIDLGEVKDVLLVVQRVDANKIELSEAEYERRSSRPQVGDFLTVVVKCVTKFGVFCAISPYEDGLVHVSQVERRYGPPEIGQSMDVVVTEMNEDGNGKLRCALSETAVRQCRN